MDDGKGWQRAVIFAILFAVAAGSNITVKGRRPDFFNTAPETLSVPTFQDLRDFEDVEVLNASMPTLSYLGDLPKLKYVTFFSAQIQRLEPHCFRNASNLRSITLRSNPIEEITGQVFEHLPICYLTLSNNSIARVHSSAFDGMPFLEQVDLGGNRIEQIDPKWFANSPNVRILDLSRNLIVEVPDGAFSNIAGVEVIHLSYNQIETIRPEAFRGLGALWALNLSNNRISEIPSSAFRGVRNLILLAKHNELRCLPEMVLEAIYTAKLAFNEIDEECKQKLRQFKEAHPRFDVSYTEENVVV